MSPAMTSMEQQALDLLIKMAPRQADQSKAPEAADFDWSTPCGFTRRQSQNLQEFATALGGRLSKAVTRMIRVPVKLQASPLKQHYQRKLAATAGERKGFCVALGADAGGQAGFIMLSGPVAVGWVASLLGAGLGAAAGERAMSALENTLLLDIVGSIVQAMQIGKEILRPAAAVLDKYEFPAGQDGTEYCELGFCIEGKEQPAVTFFLQSRLLLAVAEEAPQAQSGKAAPTDWRKILVEHLQGAPVKVDAWLGTARAAVRDLMTLQSGDILVLSTGVAQPVDVLVAGRKILLGTLAESDGQYALQIVRRVTDGKSDKNNEGKRP